MALAPDGRYQLSGPLEWFGWAPPVWPLLWLEWEWRDGLNAAWLWLAASVALSTWGARLAREWWKSPIEIRDYQLDAGRRVRITLARAFRYSYIKHSPPVVGQRPAGRAVVSDEAARRRTLAELGSSQTRRTCCARLSRCCTGVSSLREEALLDAWSASSRVCVLRLALFSLVVMLFLSPSFVYCLVDASLDDASKDAVMWWSEVFSATFMATIISQLLPATRSIGANAYWALLPVDFATFHRYARRYEFRMAILCGMTSLTIAFMGGVVLRVSVVWGMLIAVLPVFVPVAVRPLVDSLKLALFTDAKRKWCEMVLWVGATASLTALLFAFLMLTDRAVSESQRAVGAVAILAGMYAVSLTVYGVYRKWYNSGMLSIIWNRRISSR